MKNGFVLVTFLAVSFGVAGMSFAQDAASLSRDEVTCLAHEILAAEWDFEASHDTIYTEVDYKNVLVEPGSGSARAGMSVADWIQGRHAEKSAVKAVQVREMAERRGCPDELRSVAAALVEEIRAVRAELTK